MVQILIRRTCRYLGIRFFGHYIYCHFSANWAENFNVNSPGDYYLSFGDKILEIYVMMLIRHFFATFGRKTSVATTHAPNGMGTIRGVRGEFLAKCIIISLLI